MPCAICAADNPPGARFCGACGRSLGEVCARCATPVSAGQRFCTGCGHDVSGNPDVASDAGERRQATVLFSDLSGYTALNEAADPEEVEAIMGRIKAEATAVIERFGGTVNQFAGDDIMALFGVPVAHRDDPRQAVAAALELHRVVDLVIAGTETNRGIPLTMHSGISTGLVVARRSDSRAGTYALTGDAVNTAARLRSLAAPGEIVVSSDTWLQVSEHFDAQEAAPVELKGKEQPLVTHRIRGLRATAASRDGALVGRDEELREFAAMAEACAERRRSRVVVVRGDPGVGKSRLVAEFVRHALPLGFSCHSASVLDFGAETGRDAVRSLARSLLAVAAAADEGERRQAVQAAAKARRLEPGEQLFLYDLVDVAPPLHLRALAAAMSTAAREKGSLQALCDLARSASVAAPLLLIAEDIHWADAWTLERLAALAVLAAREPVLLVLTTRFAGDPTAGAWRTALHGAPLIGVDLGPLTAQDSMQLALAASTIAPVLLTRCVERAEGNPLFLLQLLLDATEETRARLPGSIQALIHARMDRLPGADKTALQAAAVLGQRYTLDALRHLIESASYECRLLVEQFLVRPDGSEFLFCHALIRDGAYASLLHSRRRRLHALAAEWFERSDLALAAEHFDRGEHPRAALAYLAASQAVFAQFHYQPALALADRGLELAAEQAARFALLMARTRLLLELGRAGDAIEACRGAIDASASPGERAQALIAMAAGMRLNDRIVEGLAALDEAEPLAAGAGLVLELSRLNHLRGNLLFPLGRHAECLREHERARMQARLAGSLEAEAAALGGLGDAHYLHGHMRSAHEQFRQCVALSRQHGFGRLEVANLPMVGWTLHHLNDIAGAVATGIEAIELAVRASQPRAEMLARALVAWVDGVLRDRRGHAEQQIEAGLRLVGILGARRFEAQFRGIRALLALRRGDRDLARGEAQAALAICRAHGMGHIGPQTYGICALVETDVEARRRLLEEGEAQLQAGCVSHNHIWLRDLAIEASLESGDWQAVERHCAGLDAYTAGEPLPLCDFTIARGLAMARFGRGERGADLQAVLARLRDSAADAGLNAALPAIEDALVAFGTAQEKGRPAGRPFL